MARTKNKRGLTSLMVVFFIFIIFFVVLFLGIQAFWATKVNDAFSVIDFQIGNVSFNETYNKTMAPGLDAIIDNSDTSGIILIFGMIVVMLIIGFKFSTSRLWIILDIFVIAVAFAVAVYLSRAFNTFINSSPELLALFSTTLQTSSTLMLNLPFIIIIAGSLIMIVTYGILRKKEEFFK